MASLLSACKRIARAEQHNSIFITRFLSNTTSTIPPLLVTNTNSNNDITSSSGNSSSRAVTSASSLPASSASSASASNSSTRSSLYTPPSSSPPLFTTTSAGQILFNPLSSSSSSPKSIVTINRESIRLYRDILRACKQFTFSDDKGRPWSHVLASSARQEFENHRYETNGEEVARLLVMGLDALMQTQHQFNMAQQRLEASLQQKLLLDSRHGSQNEAEDERQRSENRRRSETERRVVEQQRQQGTKTTLNMTSTDSMIHAAKIDSSSSSSIGGGIARLSDAEKHQRENLLVKEANRSSNIQKDGLLSQTIVHVGESAYHLDRRATEEEKKTKNV